MATLTRYDLNACILTKSECIEIADKTDNKHHAVLYTMDLILDRLCEVLEQKELKSEQRRLLRNKNVIKTA